MKLAGIFQDLERLYNFQTISYGSHFVFQNEAKIFQRQVFIAINIPCKSGEDMQYLGRSFPFEMMMNCHGTVMNCPRIDLEPSSRMTTKSSTQSSGKFYRGHEHEMATLCGSPKFMMFLVLGQTRTVLN